MAPLGISQCLGPKSKKKTLIAKEKMENLVAKKSLRKPKNPKIVKNGPQISKNLNKCKKKTHKKN